MLLSRIQAAEQLGVSVDTVARFETRGQLKPIRFNSRTVRYRLSDIEQMIQAHEGGEDL